MIPIAQLFIANTFEFQFLTEDRDIVDTSDGRRHSDVRIGEPFVPVILFSFRSLPNFHRSPSREKHKRIVLTIVGLEGPNTQDKVERVTAATGHLFEDVMATCHPLGVAGGRQTRSSNVQWAFRHLEHRPRKVSKSKQCLSEPVAPMPFMQQGISIFHTVSSTYVFQLKSAWTLWSLF